MEANPPIAHFHATSSLYEHYNRPFRDVGCTVVYVLFAMFTVFAGIAAFVKSDKHLGSYSDDFFWNSTSCNVTRFNSYNNIEDDSEGSSTTFSDAYAIDAYIWLPITAVVGIGFAVLFVVLFKNHARAMVWTSLIGAVVMSVIIAILSFIIGGVGLGIILLISAVGIAAMFWCCRSQLELCASLLSIAGTGLKENPLLVPTALVIKLCGIVVLLYMGAAFISSILVGQPGLNPSVSNMLGSETTGNGRCYGIDYDGSQVVVQCCTWQPETWAVAYAVLCWFTMIFSAMLAMQVKLYTVADVIAQWYFIPPGQNKTYPISIRSALRHALGPSMGSNVFAAAILFIISILRSIFNRMARSNVCCAILNCFVQPLLNMLQKFTNFATVITAVRGTGFVGASMEAFDLLSRNFLNTYSVWWLPDMVIGMSVFLFSLVWATFVFAIIHAGAGPSGNDRSGLAWGVSFTVFILIFFVLRFAADLLLDITNTVYMCYAMDLDTRQITKPEVHEIYQKVAALGAVVQNPDGQIAYGAPTNPADPYRYNGGSNVAMTSMPVAYPHAPYAPDQEVQPLTGQGHVQSYAYVPQGGPHMQTIGSSAMYPRGNNNV